MPPICGKVSGVSSVKGVQFMIRVWLAFLALMTAMFGVFFAYQNHTISVPTGYRGTGQFVL